MLSSIEGREQVSRLAQIPIFISFALTKGPPDETTLRSSAGAAEATKARIPPQRQLYSSVVGAEVRALVA